MFLQKVFKTHWLVALISLVNAGFLSILYVTFFQQQITLAEIILAEGMYSAATVLYIFTAKVFYARRDIQLGFLLTGLGLGILLLPFTKTFFYFFIILRGLGIVIFFIPYNILHFAKPLTGRLLEGMTRYWGIMILAGVAGPLIGAAILNFCGLAAFTFVGLALSAAGIYLAFYLPKQVFRYTARELLGHLRKIRTITMVDGALHKVVLVVTVFALLYISKVMDYSYFLAAVSLVAFLASLNMAKRSDRGKQRMIYIWLLSLAAGVVTMLFAVAHTFVAFIILTLILKVLTVLAEPARANIIQDAKEPAPINWIAREFYLNIGRALLCGVVFILMKLNLTMGVFIFLGLLFCFFPFLVRYKKVYHHKALRMDEIGDIIIK